MTMNIKAILEELKSYELKEWDIKPLVKDIIRHEFYKRFDIYPEEKIIEVSETIEASIVDLQYRYIKAYDDMETAKLFCYLHEYSYAFNAQDNQGTDDLRLRRCYLISNSSIVWLVRYTITGDFDDDYAIVNKLLDDNQIRYDNHAWTIQLNESVKIRSFKNGKIIVSGLTADQKNRIVSGFETVAKYRNATV